jgi:ADP-L-glycero-D-manno-heptose 6-epimerase
MIIVTGAAGFIGSALVGELLRQGWQDIVAVDDFSRADKELNLAGKTLSAKVDRKDFFAWLDAKREARPVHLPPRCPHGHHRVRHGHLR